MRLLDPEDELSGLASDEPDLLRSGLSADGVGDPALGDAVRRGRRRGADLDAGPCELEPHCFEVGRPLDHVVGLGDRRSRLGPRGGLRGRPMPGRRRFWLLAGLSKEQRLGRLGRVDLECQTCGLPLEQHQALRADECQPVGQLVLLEHHSAQILLPFEDLAQRTGLDLLRAATGRTDREKTHMFLIIRDRLYPEERELEGGGHNGRRGRRRVDRNHVAHELVRRANECEGEGLAGNRSDLALAEGTANFPHIPRLDQVGLGRDLRSDRGAVVVRHDPKDAHLGLAGLRRDESTRNGWQIELLGVSGDESEAHLILLDHSDRSMEELDLC